MKKVYYLFVFLSFLVTATYAQTITGTVKDQNETLIGATVRVGGTTNGTATDVNGKYTLKVSPGSYKLTASYAGYETITKDVTLTAGQTLTVDFVLNQKGNLNEVVVLGSRARPRSQLSTPVPVDVVDIK